MTNLTTKLNKLVLDNAPSKKLINAWLNSDKELNHLSTVS